MDHAGAGQAVVGWWSRDGQECRDRPPGRRRVAVRTGGHGRTPIGLLRRVPRDRPERADRLGRAQRARARRIGDHGGVHRGSWSHTAHAPRAARELAGTRCGSQFWHEPRPRGANETARASLHLACGPLAWLTRPALRRCEQPSRRAVHRAFEHGCRRRGGAIVIQTSILPPRAASSARELGLWVSARLLIATSTSVQAAGPSACRWRRGRSGPRLATPVYGPWRGSDGPRRIRRGGRLLLDRDVVLREHIPRDRRRGVLPAGSLRRLADDEERSARATRSYSSAI